MLNQLRLARLEIDYARQTALLAGWSQRKKHRHAYARELRETLRRIDHLLAQIEKEGWDT